MAVCTRAASTSTAITADAAFPSAGRKAELRTSMCITALNLPEFGASGCAALHTELCVCAHLNTHRLLPHKALHHPADSPARRICLYTLI